MAKNDIILIDGIIDERMTRKIPSEDKGEVFELFATEQIVKEYDLSYDEIISASVDGRNDGSIDFVFIFLNGHLLTDVANFHYPKSGAEIDVYFISCKHHDTFKLQLIDGIFASLSELLDFELKPENFKADYNEELIDIRCNLYTVYRKLAGAITKFTINVIYASRGNTALLGDNVLARSEQVKIMIMNNFSECTVKFLFIGCTELLTMFRKVKITDLELQIDKLLSKGTSYVILAKLTDYYRFIIDEEDKLRLYLFDSNVRDYMGLNGVNQDIMDTLDDDSQTDFWLLNNGITILVTDAHNVGDIIKMKNIQIVNGLQTSYTIYQYFSAGNKELYNRDILIKIIKFEDETIRDNIIRATNNQRPISIQSLHATDKIQRDVEDILYKKGLFYERRVKFYENQGVAKELIVNPLYIACGYISLIMKLPYRASTIKNKFMDIPDQYKYVFNQDINLNIWPQIVFILRKTDAFLSAVRDPSNTNQNFLKATRQILSFIAISILLGKFEFTITDLLSLDIEKYNDITMNKAWLLVKSVTSKNDYKVLIRRETFFDICSHCATEYKIEDLPRLKKRVNPFYYDYIFDIEDTFLDSVDLLLPDQPWHKGIHYVISRKLNCHPNKAEQAISELIKRGRRKQQFDGVICDNL